MSEQTAKDPGERLVFLSLISAVIVFALLIAVVVGSIVIQPKTGGGFQYEPETGEIETEAGNLVVP